MAEPIVRSFVIDTTQAEQNLQQLSVGINATTASLDAMYAQLLDLDGQLKNLDPNTQAFADVNTQIKQLETTITQIETGKIDEIGTALEGIDAGNAAQSIEQVGNAVEQVVAPVNQLANATDQLNNELKETKVDTSSIETASADFQELAVEQEQVTTSSKSLKAQLRELQQQLAATDPDSAKYRELSQAAGELKDRIQDAAQAVGTQAGGAFERVGGSLGLVTSRISNLDFEGAAEGAKLLAKNITDIKPGDIAKGIQGIGSAFASIGKALLTNPIFLIGAAIAAAIVYSEELLSLIDGVTDAETKALNVQKERAALAKENYDNISATEETLKRQGFTEEQITQLKLEQLNTAIAEQQAVVETTRLQAEGQIKAAERNAEYLKTFLDFVTFPQRKLAEFFQGFVNGSIEILNKLGLGIEKIDVTSAFDDVNNFITKKIFDPEQERKDQEKIVKDAEKSTKQLIATRDGLLNARDAKDKSRRDKQIADAKAASDKALADEKAALDKQLAAQKDYYDKLADLQDTNYENTLTKEEQEELAIIQKYETLFAAADAAGIQTIDLQKQLNAELAALDAQRTANATAEAEKRKQLEADTLDKDFLDSYKNLQNEFIAAEDTRYFNSLNNTEQEELRITQKYENLFAKADAAGKDTTNLQKELARKLKEIQDDAANQELATKRITAEQGLQLAQGALQVLQAFSDNSNKKGEAAARKKFKTDKALAIGAATVQTASAVTGALTAGGNPVKLATGAQFVEASIAAALGLAQIIKIKNSQFGGGGGGGNDTTTSVPSTGGTDTGGGAAVAQFNPLAASFLQDRPEQLTPRAYVLAGDVASQQEVREKVQDLARIG
jgi:hypothetical protein